MSIIFCTALERQRALKCQASAATFVHSERLRNRLFFNGNLRCSSVRRSSEKANETNTFECFRQRHPQPYPQLLWMTLRHFFAVCRTRPTRASFEMDLSVHKHCNYFDKQSFIKALRSSPLSALVLASALQVFIFSC